jgi:diguanylate cyclase (GGDEF)-like protein
MDPLVRATLGLQQLIVRGTGLFVSLLLGGYLICWAADPPESRYNLAAMGVLLTSLAVHLYRRLRRLAPRDAARRDLELFTTLTTLTFALVLHTAGGLEGPFYPALYALMMAAAAFAKPRAAVMTVLYAACLETGLHFIAFGHRDAEQLWTHATFLAVFAFLNVTLFRAELARMRRLSRARIQSEIDKMKEAARSYRLVGTTSSEQHKVDRHDDEDRLLQSSVDEIHQAVSFALDLLRRSLDLNSALLLSVNSQHKELRIQELSTEWDGVLPGPFSTKDGIFGALVARQEAISVAGPRAGGHASYYRVRPEVGAISARPLMEHGHLRGVLVVDREERRAFSDAEQDMLDTATHFILRALENERTFGHIQRAKTEQGKLYRAAEALAAASTEANVIEAAVHHARKFAAFDFAAVTLFHRQAAAHEICAVSGSGSDVLVGQRFRHNTGLVSMAVANRHALPYRGHYDAGRQVVFTAKLRPPDMPSLLVLPLAVHERVLGTLVLGSEQASAFGDDVRPTLEVLASHMAVSLANARMLKRLEEMATTDGLTGLYNKRALVVAAAEKLRSAKRFSKPLSVLVGDIDHFKRVNDTYGHDVGDVVIKGFAEVLKRAKRDTDIVGRFGGEEFVVVCEQTGERGAELLAERIRSEFEATTFQTELGPLNVTCSVGVATAPHAGQTWETVFKSTDDALYASKRGGRNRVTLWSSKLQGAA